MASDRRPEPEWDAGSGPPPGRGGPNPVPTGSGRHPGGGAPAHELRDGGFREATRAASTRKPGRGCDRHPPEARRVRGRHGAGARGPSLAVADPPGCPRGRRPRARLPGYRSAGARRARTGRPGARSPAAAVPLRAVAGTGVRARLLRAPALLDRRLRRSVPMAGAGRLGGAAPRAARRGDGGHLTATALATVGRDAVGRRRGAPGPVRPRRLPLGTAGFQPDAWAAAVAGGLRRGAPGRLRGRAHRCAAGGRRTRTGPSRAEFLTRLRKTRPRPADGGT